jgi:hypothetical protein
MLASDHFEESAPGDKTIEEFFHHRETANGTGSIFQLWPGDDPEEWENNFAELLRANGRTLYISSWDGGMCANGSECIEEFLGHYWGSKTNDGISGPYESFAYVFEDEYFRYIGGGTKNIWCYEMTTEDLLSQVILDEDLEPGFTIGINDKPYVLTEEFRLIPAGLGHSNDK